MTVLITGGAGFIGANLAAHLARGGHRVRIYDDLSRARVEHNVRWLRETCGDRLEIVFGDVRDRARLRDAVAGAEAVFHFAAQTAITTSLVEPRRDFEVNAGGTLEVLEALRTLAEAPPLVFASTSKVYGCLDDLDVAAIGQRWRPVDDALAARGIGEAWPLAFCAPYGCSKGAADQYVLDYAHTYELPATVLRMSCVYGPHQYGTEDQGWVTHFARCALEGEPITIYGDGRQLRDVLYVDDLLDALVRAWTRIDQLRGRAFNLGGGPHNTLSLLELVDRLARLHGRRPAVRWEAWRPSDQRYYVSDPRAFMAATEWEPRVAPDAGVAALYAWLAENRRQPPAHDDESGVLHA